ncbi:MAG: hypothetical protein AB2L09_02375 [Coriobacteriia bacterium]
MNDGAGTLISCAVLLIGTWLLPWLAMRALMPALERSPLGSRPNYRGRSVTLGLGLVWLIWAVGIQLAAVVMDLLAQAFPDTTSSLKLLQVASGLPLTLVLGALLFGFLDDVVGNGAERGFRGHLRALRAGRLTTGGLKLLGIGLLAAGTLRPDTNGGHDLIWSSIGVWVLQVLAIALTANLVNLMDLRPGRALKLYSVLVLLCGAFLVWFGGAWKVPSVLIVLLGPVAAIWTLDLRERGMQGDAGANASGALIGWMFAVLLNPWVLLGYVVLVLALNLASERVSFSRVIESNAFLNRLDRLGRLPDGRHHG